MTNLRNRFINLWKSPAQKSEQDYWQTYYEEEEIDYGWLKKLIIAIIIFFAVYGAHASDTALGSETVNAVRKVLTTQTDYVYWLNRGIDYGSRHFPNALNWAEIPFLNDVRTTVAKPADPLLYMSKPVEGQLKAAYGWYTDPIFKQDMFHEGIDIAAPLGASVRSAAPGKVRYIGDTGEMGQILIVEHGQDIETVYGYLGEVLVKSDEFVSQGQVVARVGKVKRNNQNISPDEPTLYFEVRQNSKTIDPLTRISGEFPK